MSLALSGFRPLTENMPLVQFNYCIHISYKNRYAFFEVSKAGCTSVKGALQKIEIEGSGVGEQSLQVHPNVLCSPFVKPFQLDTGTLEEVLFGERFFRFAFVRNPYSRFLSAYLDKIVRSRPQKKQVLQALDLPVEELERDISFATFADVVSAQTPKQMDQHWRVQTAQLFDGHVKFNFIGRVETMDSDIEKIDAMWFDGALAAHYKPILWHATNADSKIAEAYDDRIAAQVRAIYASDFERYGYSQDLPV